MTELIVVGFDGSTEAQAAVRWGVKEAKIRRAPCRIVAAVEGVPSPSLWGVPVPPRVSQEELDQARQRVENALAELGLHEEDGLEMAVRYGHPAAVLIHESQNAALLVLGAQGLGGFLHAMLGGVSNTVVARAQCPVTIVR